MLFVRGLSSLSPRQRTLAAAVFFLVVGIPFATIVLPNVEHRIAAVAFNNFIEQHTGAPRAQIIDDIARNGWSYHPAIYTSRGWSDYNAAADTRPASQRPKSIAIRISARAGGTFACGSYETAIAIFSANADRLLSVVDRRLVNVCL